MTGNDASPKEALTFAPMIEVPESLLRPSAPLAALAKPASGDKEAMLASACQGDKKCSCINRAIFVHDSGFATAGVGKRANNPCNMRRPGTWDPKGVTGETGGAVGHFLVFDSLQSGINACVEVYTRFYTDLTASQLVSRWTAGGGNANYRAAVSACY